MKYVHGWAFPDADDFMVRQIQPNGDYQDAHYDAAMRFVTDRRAAIDGGAHIGTWTRLMARDFEHVIAFEPSPDTFEAFTANRLTFQWTNVDARHAALGAAPGTVDMMLDPPNIERKNTGGRRVQPGRTIPVVTIDSLALPALGLLKLDVEGSEPASLAGATETVHRCRPVILFEDKKLWLHYGYPKDAVARWLLTAGYRFADKVRRDEIWVPV